MSTKVIIIALAFTTMGEMSALAYGMSVLAYGSKLQAAQSANVHAMNLDRCPYYPSSVFCRDSSRARVQDQLGHWMR